jgi:transposase-like protein
MTDKSVEIVEGLVVRAPANGRRTYSETGKRALVQISLRPGVSVAGLALANGINANLLRRWITQYGPEAKAGNGTSSGASLLPVSTSPAATPRVAPSADCYIEMTYLGTTIRICGAVEPRALGVVLDCLGQRA